MALDERAQPEVRGQGRRRQQPPVVDQSVVVKGHTNPVETVR
jgi:hypothetical protein